MHIVNLQLNHFLICSVPGCGGELPCARPVQVPAKQGYTWRDVHRHGCQGYPAGGHQHPQEEEPGEEEENTKYVLLIKKY